MSKLNRLAYGLLDSVLEEHGEDWLLELFCARIGEGCPPYDIAKNLGFTYTVMRRWLEASQHRMDAWACAKRAYADKLAYDGLGELVNADLDNLSLARARYDGYGKMAGKLSRDEWGDKQRLEVENTTTVNIKDLLTLREARIAQLAAPVESSEGEDFIEGELVNSESKTNSDSI